ncbi:MAG: ABC transporter permease [Clostridia bacterium]|nr:ABC transporter permease [Clostridia bacterium]MBR2407220.1 ABC transporter permease [Clostridia bacterium]
MAENTVNKHRHEPLFHLAKRDDLVWWKAWLIRLAAILIGMLIVGILSSLLTGAGFFETYGLMFRGTFGRVFQGRTSMLWRFLQQTAILLCLSLAVTPAFKMKFWNCGAEGQALIGGWAAMVCMMKLGGTMPNGLLIVVVVLASIVAGAIWGLIPALFGAQYRTNETLFTLMMNYVATQIVSYYVDISSGGSQVIQPVSTGALPIIGNLPYLLNVLIVTVLTVAMFIYLKYSKHGYEIAVVGESRNTAKYIGINVKTVMIRTMLISGAVCGIAGMLLVAGTDHSINTNTVGGQGFTAIMISWLGQFNPFIMAGMSALVIFLETGAAKVADTFFLNSSMADIVSGVVILFLVGCEFFIRYTVKFRHSKKGGEV